MLYKRTKFIAILFFSLFLISSCSNKDDALIGGQYQENLTKMDQVYGYCDNPLRNINKKSIEYEVCKDKEAAAGADGIDDDNFRLFNLTEFMNRGGEATVVYNQSANKYLWDGSMKVLSQYPIKNLDSEFGYIETDWIYEENNLEQRCLVKIQIVSLELVSNGVEAKFLCQKKIDGQWVQDKNDYSKAEKQIVLAVLSEAGRYSQQN
jgi:hypothetical protein